MATSPFSQELKRLRERSRLSQTQMARFAGVSLSSYNRWELGKSLPRRERAEKIDKILKADGLLLSRLQEAEDGHTIPPWLRDIVRVESEARTVDIVSLVTVPGYLQSESYARSLFRASRPLATEAEIQRLVQLRCGRLEQLAELRVTAVFPASAITATPADIRTDQAGRLMFWAASGRVAIHLVPEGSLLSVPAAPIQVYTLPNGERVIYGDWAAGTVLAEATQHARLSEMVAAASRAALPTVESLKLLERYTDE